MRMIVIVFSVVISILSAGLLATEVVSILVDPTMARINKDMLCTQAFCLAAAFTFFLYMAIVLSVKSTVRRW